jgi:hypothetical protein
MSAFQKPFEGPIGPIPATQPDGSNGPPEPRAPFDTLVGADPSELEDDAPTQPFIRRAV